MHDAAWLIIRNVGLQVRTAGIDGMTTVRGSKLSTSLELSWNLASDQCRQDFVANVGEVFHRPPPGSVQTMSMRLSVAVGSVWTEVEHA